MFHTEHFYSSFVSGACTDVSTNCKWDENQEYVSFLSVHACRVITLKRVESAYEPFKQFRGYIYHLLQPKTSQLMFQQ